MTKIIEKGVTRAQIDIEVTLEKCPDLSHLMDTQGIPGQLLSGHRANFLKRSLFPEFQRTENEAFGLIEICKCQRRNSIDKNLCYGNCLPLRVVT